MKTILIVEDEFGIAEALNDILTEEGYRIILASNGREGLDRLEQQVPDLVLVDLMMPFMDGLAMIKEARKNPAWQAVPFVLMSAIAEPPPDGTLYQGFLRKPFDLTALISLAERLLAEER